MIAAVSTLKLLPHLMCRFDAAVTPQLLRAIASAAEEQNVLIKDLSVDHRSLEDVFLDITGREMRT